MLQRQFEDHGSDVFSVSGRGHYWYFSQVLPFTIPRMVSGPDFFPDSAWRRNIEDAPAVTPTQFCSAFARRIEAPCRTDWTALPIIRSVTYKWTSVISWKFGAKEAT